MKILWLCSWYPNELKPFEGDFIQRHAKAVSLIHEVQVIFIKKDEHGTITKSISKEITTGANLTETIIYYNPFKTRIGVIDKIISDYQYKKIYKNTLKEYLEQNVKPPFVHVHVAMKAGIAALWLKKKFNIPFILSEHWTGYLPEAKPNIYDQDFTFRCSSKNIFAHAYKVTAVSKVLANDLNRIYNVQPVIIPNVVDTNIFFSVEKKQMPITKFIHISTITHQKNITQVLEAFSIAGKKGYQYELTFYTPEVEKLKMLINEYGISSNTVVHEDVPQHLLAKDIQNSDALILYSRYETFGCVVIEANACGIPALLSDLPVFREYIVENKSGVFAKPNDPEALSEVIIQFIKNRNGFNRKEIENDVSSKFNYAAVAKQFDEVYKSLIH